MFVQRVLITPTRICPQLPVMEQSNRILRKFHTYSHRFVRASFVDENFGFITGDLSDDIVEWRLRVIMHNGINVGGEHFVFLHYSSSQLREQSCWFYNESVTNSKETHDRGVKIVNKFASLGSTHLEWDKDLVPLFQQCQFSQR